MIRALGSSCSNDHPCSGDRTCAAWPGGYCTAACAGCEGACVAVPRGGDVCAAGCMADAQCRVAEGYTCDPAWHACLIPNTAVIVPRRCTAIGQRDPAMSPVVTSAHGFDPAAELAGDGSVVAIAATVDGELRSVRAGKDSMFAVHGSQPALARDARGTLYATWCNDAHAELAISRDGGATWSPPSSVRDPGDTACERPVIALGRDVMYIAYGASGLRVRASRDGGRTFTTAVTALAGSKGTLAVGGDGKLHAVALDGSDRGGYGAAEQRVQYSVSSDGGATFAQPRVASAPDETLPYYFAVPRIAIDNKKRWLYIAYVRGGRSGVWDLALAASKDGGATWKHVRIGDDAQCALHMTPALALDSITGQLHVAWYDTRGGTRFARAVCTPGLATCTQLGRVSDAAFALPVLDPQRSGEQAGLLVDERRRVIHALWVQDGVLASASAALPPR